MSQNKQLAEPQVPPLFARLFPNDALKLRRRRFYGLDHLTGMKPNDPVTDSTHVSYYVARDERKQEQIALLQLEAKSAADDRALKFFLMLSFLVLVAAEIIAALAHGTIPVGWIGTGVLIAMTLNAVACARLAMKFDHMDHIWANKVDGFFGPGVRRRMESIRDCMREFKRFVKWRRFMSNNLALTIVIWLIQISLLALVAVAPASLPLQPTANWWSVLILLLELAWIVFFWWADVYYTQFRDPTLQLCIMVNVISREGMPTPEVATSATSADHNGGD